MRVLDLGRRSAPAFRDLRKNRGGTAGECVRVRPVYAHVVPQDRSRNGPGQGGASVKTPADIHIHPVETAFRQQIGDIGRQCRASLETSRVCVRADGVLRHPEIAGGHVPASLENAQHITRILKFGFKIRCGKQIDTVRENAARIMDVGKHIHPGWNQDLLQFRGIVAASGQIHYP